MENELTLAENVQTMITRLEELRTEVRAEREVRLAEQKAHEKRTRLMTAAIIISVLVALGSLFVGFRAKSTADDLIANRTQFRVVACISTNDFATKHNNFVLQTISERETLINETNNNPNLTEKQKEDSNAFFAKQIDGYRKQIVAIRDCSPDAVNAFYEGTP